MCPEDTDRPPDEGTGDSTATFRADYSAKLEAPAADAEAGLRSVQVLPSSPARLVVKRGPNAGARFLLTKPVTSVGRHPGSDIFLDHVTVSRRHAEFHCEKGNSKSLTQAASMAPTSTSSR